MKTYKDIYILTNGQTEKLAALTWLSAKTGLSIAEDVISETIDNVYVTEYPCVFADSDEEVSAAAKNSDVLETKIGVLFADINRVEEILKKENRPKPAYGKKYFDKHKNFVIPIKTASEKVVFAGLRNDPFWLYSDDPRTEENAIKYLKQDGWVLEE